LKYAQLTLVDHIQNVDLKAKKVTVKRKLEGRHEIVEASMPVMMTVVREINHRVIRLSPSAWRRKRRKLQSGITRY